MALLLLKLRIFKLNVDDGFWDATIAWLIALLFVLCTLCETVVKSKLFR